MVLIYESGQVRIMMQEDELLIEAGSEPRIFIIIEGNTVHHGCPKKIDLIREFGIKLL